MGDHAPRRDGRGIGHGCAGSRRAGTGPGTQPSAQLPVHHGGRLRMGRPLLLRAQRIPDAANRLDRGARHEIHARLCQFGSLQRDAVRADHRTLPISPAGRARRTAGRAGPRPVARSPDAPLIAATARLPHRADRQMASWQPAQFRPAQERLRRVLGQSRRRCGLFHPQGRRPARRLGRRCEGGRARILYRPAGRALDRISRGPCAGGQAVAAQPPFHGCPLALGGQ